MPAYTKLCARLIAEANNEDVDSFFNHFCCAFLEGNLGENYNGPSAMVAPFSGRKVDGVHVWLYDLRRLSHNAVTFYTRDHYAYFVDELKKMQKAHPRVDVTIEWANRASQFPGARTRVMRTASGAVTHTAGDADLALDEEFEEYCFEESGIVESDSEAEALVSL